VAVVEAATQALAKGTEAFAAERMNRGIRRPWPARTCNPFPKIRPHARHQNSSPPEYCPKAPRSRRLPAGSICEALLDNGIKIEHACDMSCACTTCHVIVREGSTR
jgi:hypothetical protein